MTNSDSAVSLFQDQLDQHESEMCQRRREAVEGPGPTHNMEYDIMRSEHICSQVRENDCYAQNLYAAMCNRDWQEQDVWEILTGVTWSCSWRYAGGIVARIRGVGSYIDWYCSGIADSAELGQRTFVAESVVTEQIRQDLASIGWVALPEEN